METKESNKLIADKWEQCPYCKGKGCKMCYWSGGDGQDYRKRRRNRLYNSL